MNTHICQCLSRLATFRRNSQVTICVNRRKTGMQFVNGVLGLACGLLDIGLQPGDVVALCALNSDWYLEWLLAVAFVGGIAAPLNYRWSLDEATYTMEVVRAVMLVTDECCSYWYSKLQRDSMPFLRWHVFMNSPPDYSRERYIVTTETLGRPGLISLSFNYLWAPEGAAIICFTSGTTGRPKGVTISHSALIIQSVAKIAVVGYGEDDVYLHTAPLCHIGGISSAMAMLMAGGCHVLIPKFDAKSATEAIDQYNVTSLITVPAIMADIVSLIRIKKTWKGKETVRKILNGGGGLSVELIKDATRFFPKARLLSAYGMTETCSSLTFLTLYDPTSINSSHSHITTAMKFSLACQPGAICVGKPASHIELKIKFEDSSSSGRILTRGPHVMLGYWGQISSKASNSPSDSEGWLDTGDIGEIDDLGNVWLIGRNNGRIKSGGENVYPEEVEAILSRHPGVSGVVVVGLPDTRLTEMVVACVKLRDNWRWADSYCDHSTESKNQTVSNEILQKFCREKQLTGYFTTLSTVDFSSNRVQTTENMLLVCSLYIVLHFLSSVAVFIPFSLRFKVPKRIFIWRKQFPLTTTGKFRRDEVRREVMSCMQLLPSNL